jgi:hypothetical protein
VSRTSRLLWGIGSGVLLLLGYAAFVQGAYALLLVASLLWFALTALTGPGAWRR